VNRGAGSIWIGSAPSQAAIDQIQQNKTTRKEAIALLGEPTKEMLSLSGQLVLNWNYWEANFAGGRKIRAFRLFFNDADVVVATTSNVIR
jgi:hypothetical protein